MKPKRARTARREAEREDAKAREAREKLARMEPGGSEATPLVVPSASVVEVRATALGCVQCGGDLRVTEHAAAPHGRTVDLACKRCRSRRRVFVVIAQPN